MLSSELIDTFPANEIILETGVDYGEETHSLHTDETMREQGGKELDVR